MRMGKRTAKRRDAVPVCFVVEGKEIKRYRNIEIPDDLKKLEYRDFKFDVSPHDAIAFKIMFAPSVLPEIFPQAGEQGTRKAMPQEAVPQEEQPAEPLLIETVEALAQALEDAPAAGELANALADADGGYTWSIAYALLLFA